MVSTRHPPAIRSRPTPSPRGTQTSIRSRERERERATPRSTLPPSGGQSRPAQRRDLLRTSQSAERLAPPKFVPRDAQAFPDAQAERNGLDLDLERRNKRGAHAPHNIRTRKGFTEGPARELAGEYGGDAERDAEGLQRGAEGAVTDEYEVWTRRPKSAGPAYDAIPVSGPRSMAQIPGLIQYWRGRQQWVSFARIHRGERARVLWTLAKDEEVASLV
ncbi:hypothetical protein K438DRAFT_1785108 [Mycena galopus ATCC 62051]|nr:hypothetical protein K438DRAFT_1785108 [Mycena galopus ATCC 62051]